MADDGELIVLEDKGKTRLLGTRMSQKDGSTIPFYIIEETKNRDFQKVANENQYDVSYKTRKWVRKETFESLTDKKHKF